MGIFGEQTYGSLRPEPIGLPVEDLKAANQQLEGQYLTNRENANQLQIAIANMQVLSKDDHFKNEVLEKVQSNLNNVVERNDWEYAQPVVSDAAKTAATDKGFNAAQKMKAYRDTWLGDEKKAIESGRKNANDVALATKINDDMYGGIVVNPDGSISGQWGELEVAEDPKILELMDKLGKDFQSDKTPVEYSVGGKTYSAFIQGGQFMRNVGNGYFQTATLETVPEEEVYAFYMAAVGGDAKVQAYMDMQNKFDNYATFGNPNLSKIDMNGYNKNTGTSNRNTLIDGIVDMVMQSNPGKYTKQNGVLLQQKIVEQQVTTAGGVITQKVPQYDDNGNPVLELANPYGIFDEAALNGAFDPQLSQLYDDLRTNQRLSSTANAFADKYGYEKVEANYYLDHFALEKYKADLDYANKKRLMDEEEAKKYKGDFFATTSEGENVKIRSNKEIEDEKKTLNPNSIKDQVRLKELDEELERNAILENAALVKVFDKNCSESWNKLISNIKNGSLNAATFKKAAGDVFGNGSMSDDMYSEIFNAIKKDELSPEYEAFMKSRLAYNAIAGNGRAGVLLTDNDKENMRNDENFGMAFHATRYFQNSGDVIPETYNEALTSYYEANPVTMTRTSNAVIFYDKNTQELYNGAVNQALGLSDMTFSVDGSTDVFGLNELQDVNGNKVNLDLNTRKYTIVDSKGKKISEGDYQVFGTASGGKGGGKVVLGNGMTFYANTPTGKPSIFDYSLGAGLVAITDNTIKMQDAVGYSHFDFMLQSGAIVAYTDNGQMIDMSTHANQRWNKGGNNIADGLAAYYKYDPTMVTDADKLDQYTVVKGKKQYNSVSRGGLYPYTINVVPDSTGRLEYHVTMDGNKYVTRDKQTALTLVRAKNQ